MGYYIIITLDFILFSILFPIYIFFAQSLIGYIEVILNILATILPRILYDFPGKGKHFMVIVPISSPSILFFFLLK